MGRGELQHPQEILQEIFDSRTLHTYTMPPGPLPTDFPAGLRLIMLGLIDHHQLSPQFSHILLQAGDIMLRAQHLDIIAAHLTEQATLLDHLQLQAQLGQIIDAGTRQTQHGLLAQVARLLTRGRIRQPMHCNSSHYRILRWPQSIRDPRIAPTILHSKLRQTTSRPSVFLLPT